MDNVTNLDHITTTTCDSCGRKGPAVLHHHTGTPVLAQCPACGPSNFEAQSRREIDAWLAGGEFR